MVDGDAENGEGALWETIDRWLSWGSLGLVALLGVAYVAVDQWWEPKSPETLQVTVKGLVIGALVGLIPIFMIAVGSYVFLRNLRASRREKSRAEIVDAVVAGLALPENLQRVSDDVARSLPARVIDGYLGIHSAAGDLVTNARESIRASVFRDVHEAEQPGYWTEVVKTLKRGRDTKEPVVYQVLFGFTDRSAMQKASEAHLAFFRKNKVADYVSVRFLAVPVGVDMVIVDEGSMIMAIPTTRESPAARRAVQFRDAPEFVRSVAAWYGTHLWVRGDETIEGAFERGVGVR